MKNLRIHFKVLAWLCALIIFMARPVSIWAYDIGSGRSYNDGYAYEESCWTPNCCMWGLGILTTAALVAGLLIYINSDSGFSLHAAEEAEGEGAGGHAHS